MLNEDYKDILRSLGDEQVEYLLVGAYALAVHGYPRATKDIDLLVRPEHANAEKLLRALARFGAPVQGLSAAEFAAEGVVYQIGSGPRRIDILTRLDGLAFEPAYARRVTVSLEGLEVNVISREDLIINKRASGRTQDLADLERLGAAPP